MSACASSPGAGPSSSTSSRTQIKLPDMSDMQTLDRSRFDTKVPSLGVVVEPRDVKRFKMHPTVRHLMLDIPKVVSIDNGPEGKRTMRLKVKSQDELPEDARQLFASEGCDLVPSEVTIGYDHFSASEVLAAVLPPTMEDIPSSYAQTGHIAHVNLRDEALPYKRIIGEVILSKNKTLRTVVNKLASIHAEYRFFDMEVIAGEDNEEVFVSTVNESNCTFTLNFKTVYWNSRLHTEHERLVNTFAAGEVVADVMAGVGPFAVPAAKKGCLVLGNDLNPEGTKWMEVNRVNNKVEQSLRITTTDGRAFIRSSPVAIWNNPFPPIVWPKSRKQKDAEAKKARKEREAAAAAAATAAKAGGEAGDQPSSSIAAGLASLSLGTSTESESAEPTPSTEPAPQQVAHFVMNLPDSALTFLDAYRGSYVALKDKLSAADLASQANARETINMPMVHVYCFTREMERANAERDICARASQYLGYDLTPAVGEYNLHLVRSVAPNKEMYCLSFRLPEEVAFARD